MNLIVAVDREWGIGNKGDLLVRIRQDLKNFRALTQGKVVVYGFNTLATFPGGKALKNRTNIVLTRKKDFCSDDLIVVHSVEEFLSISKSYNSDDIFVIGGESIYRQLLDYCDTAYVTKIEQSFEKDAFMPNLDKDEAWVCVDMQDVMTSDPATDSHGNLKYRFTVYKNKESMVR